MAYCINHLCGHRQNPDSVEACLSCGTPLVINDRIRLLTPLRPLTENPYVYFEVFEVEDAGTKWHPVREKRILKILKWNTPDLVKLIERESQTLQLINHPKIPRSSLHDYFTFVLSNGLVTLHCLLMDKLEGQNLEDWVEKNGRISQSLALDWLKQLVEILDTVHGCNFFHRDIKPANIMLQPNGELALIDFGSARRVTDTYLAKVSGSAGTDTGRGGLYEITAFISTRYSPLEQINGQAVPQSDFYALGRTFVRLITGTSLMKLPIDDQSGNIIWRNKAPQIDKPFADFLDNLMSPFPGQRPMSTKVIWQRLEKLPRQSKAYSIVTSKTFIFTAGILAASLIGFMAYFISLPIFANNLVAEGQKLESENNSEEAQKLFRQATNISPSLSLQIAKFYAEKAEEANNDLLLQKKYYDLAIQYNPQNKKYYIKLALTCQSVGDDMCAMKAYEEIFRLDPKSWEGHYNLGSFYESQKEYALAEKQYKLAIEYSGDQKIAIINNLSRLKNLQDKYDEAVKIALDGLGYAPNNDEWKSALYKNLGWARTMQGKHEEAEKYLQEAFDLDPQRIDALCLLAKTKESLGKRDESNSYWEFCLLGRTDAIGYLPEIHQWRQEFLGRVFKARSNKRN
ncbi:MAG: tetratricopeptide repeat protein [Gloeotrichia echinulata HAB0833]